jgi:hypothetical protein
MTQQQTPRPTLPDPYRQPRGRALTTQTWLVIWIVAPAAFLGSLTFMAWPALKPSFDPPPPASTTHTVVYQADGTGARGVRSANVTLHTDSGGTSQASINLPMKTRAGQTGLTFTNFHTGDFVYLSVQNTDAAGSVTCRILVDGVVLSENTSTGGYVIATCSGRVP